MIRFLTCRRGHQVQVAALAGLVLISAGFAGCARGPEQGAVRPETEQPMAERPVGPRDDRMVGQAERAETADLHRLMDADNNFRKAVTDVRISAEMGDIDAYHRDVDRAFERADSALEHLGLAAVGAQPGVQPVAERPFGDTRELPQDLQSRLDQMRNMERVEGDTFNAAQEQRRWMMTADYLQQIQQQVPDSQAVSQQINEIRTMASNLSQENFMENEPELLAKTQEAIGALTESLENRYVSMVAQQQPVQTPQ